MYQQLNIHQLYALPTLDLCVLYLSKNSDLCHLQHKLVGFYSRDKKCLQRGTDWVFKQSSLRFVFKRLIIFFSSLVVSTANEQFLDCATVALSERYNISWGKGGGSFMRNQSKHKTEENREARKHGVIRIAIKRAGNENTRMNTKDGNFT
jgi:hypothetical protein